MEDQRNRRVFFFALVIAALEATLGAGEHHIRHLTPVIHHYWPPAGANGSKLRKNLDT
jgi:hypothetical protein